MMLENFDFILLFGKSKKKTAIMDLNYFYADITCNVSNYTLLMQCLSINVLEFRLLSIPWKPCHKS